MTNIHALSGIPTHDPSIQAVKIHALDQCFSNCGLWTTGGLRWFARWSKGRLEIESIAKTESDELKIHPYMSVLKLYLLVVLQQKVGELVLSITPCPSILILENTLN
jgi:hypothetical protein